ncbi:TetR family transcriptional regulator [Leucobacter sp. CSA1]|uniref:TetR family transcriptional regulator n=1 Tax=Leucobacter chromiisoli TaxID=2796471 RepID=A0A934Q8Y5_9MICO|nr:TetR/AcrR family transcriptional regulator [Leucobacter chromiisoli]MBK0420404.1 TetR family transcriptional regulator [Leucobacter chromiisoli]
MRPDLSEVRRKQILDGATRCVALHGVEALTLASVADEVGMSRSHIRHYMGNRDELLQALVKHLGSRYSEQLSMAVEAADPSRRVEAALDHLFGDYWDEDLPEDSAAIDALIAFSANSPERGLTLLPYYLGIESLLTKILGAGQVEIDPRTGDVAYSILCLAYGSSSMRTMGFPRDRRDAARAVADAITGELLG